LKLTVELVPSSSWADNVRSIVSKKQWDIIKSQVTSKAYNLCEICGGIGPKHPVECHEIWHYDDKKSIQKLIGMIALCPNCHIVKHFGLAQVMNRTTKAMAHLMKINKISATQANDYINNAFKIWSERSKKIWKLDLSYLKEYGINIDKVSK
jgi:hypothetical protein